MNTEARQRALETIRENIAQSGHHLYVVTGGQTPRWAYSIGLTPTLGFELIFAGGISFMYSDVVKIVGSVIERLRCNPASERSACVVDSFGSFSFRRCDPSWTGLLLLGANDFYHRTDVPGLQIVPDTERTTIDVPNLEVPFSPESAPVWRWLTEPWSYSVPISSHAATDLQALRGSLVTEACRWEDDYWELFAGAGPDVTEEERRIVPLGTLLAVDPSLTSVLGLKIGDGIWREAGSEWQIWRATATEPELPA